MNTKKTVKAESSVILACYNKHNTVTSFVAKKRCRSDHLYLIGVTFILSPKHKANLNITSTAYTASLKLRNGAS